jgi:hypothetical protein
MKATGGAYVAVAFAFFVFLIFPFRAGDRWAFWALPVLGLLLASSSFNAMYHLASHTQADLPFAGPVGGAALCLVAFGLSAFDSQNTGQRA